MHNLLSKQK